MNAKSLALISTLVNLVISLGKFSVGLFACSIALVAEALHSLLDVASSFVTFWGIRMAERPADEKHPYGYERYEGLASLVVVILLFASAVWIFYEAAGSILSGKAAAEFSTIGVGLMALSTVINEIMARLKFSFGNRFSSLALVTDAEHSRADVISSLAVLLGLILVMFYPLADSVLALLLALYISWEAYQLSKETAGSLVDTANQELEEKISTFLRKNNYAFDEIRTRQVGASNFAEISLLYDPKAKVGEVAAFSKSVEDRLMAKFPELKQVSLLVKSHDFDERVIRPRFGSRFRYRRGFRQLGPEVKGKRTAVPLVDGEIAPSLGAAAYLVVDVDSQGRVLQRIEVKNPYYESGGAGHGVKFLKSVSADRVVTKEIGEEARKNLESLGVKVEVVDKKLALEDLNYA